MTMELKINIKEEEIITSYFKLIQNHKLIRTTLKRKCTFKGCYNAS